MFRKSIIIKGLILLLVVGVLSGVGYKIKENIFEKKEVLKKDQTKKQKRNEVLPPLEVDLELKKKHLLLGDIADVELITLSKGRTGKAIITFQTKGSLTLLGNNKFELKEFKKGVPYHFTTQIKISDIGKGEITGNVLFITPEGRPLYSNSDSLFFIISKEEVSFGKGAFILVEIERLKQKLETGTITEKEYHEELRKIIGARGGEEAYILHPNGTKEYILHPDGRAEKSYIIHPDGRIEYIIQPKK